MDSKHIIIKLFRSSLPIYITGIDPNVCESVLIEDAKHFDSFDVAEKALVKIAAPGFFYKIDKVYFKKQ